MIKLKTILNKVLKEEEEDFNVTAPSEWNQSDGEFIYNHLHYEANYEVAQWGEIEGTDEQIKEWLESFPELPQPIEEIIEEIKENSILFTYETKANGPMSDIGTFKDLNKELQEQLNEIDPLEAKKTNFNEFFEYSLHESYDNYNFEFWNEVADVELNNNAHYTSFYVSDIDWYYDSFEDFTNDLEEYGLTLDNIELQNDNVNWDVYYK